MSKEDFTTLMMMLSLFIGGAALGAAFSRVATRTAVQQEAIANQAGELYNDESGLIRFRFLPRGK